MKVGDETIDKVRNNAFLFARQILIQGKAVSYAEQFQGMYALTRGLVSVFALGSAYWLGWAAAAVRDRFLVLAAFVILAATVLTLVNISAVLFRKISDPLTKHKVELGYALVSFLCIACHWIRPRHPVSRHAPPERLAGISCGVGTDCIR